MKPMVPTIPAVSLQVQLDRDREVRKQVSRARWRRLTDRLEVVLFVVGLAVMVGVLGPSLDDESSIAIAMGMMVR
jgi:hypothetical protein